MCHVSQRSSRLGVAALVAVSMMTAACDDNHDSTKTHLLAFGAPLVSTIPFSTSIVPQRLGLTPIIGLRCPLFPSVATRFDLVVISAGGDLFVNQVSFRLLSGSSIGGSPLLVSASDLNARFGSTLIPAGTRRIFAFDPLFGCGGFVPLSLEADVVLLERSGFRHETTIVAPIE